MCETTTYTRIGGLALLVAMLVCSSVACGDADDETQDDEITYDEFAPFSEANMTSQLARLETHSEIVDLRKEASVENATDVYEQIEAKYDENDLSAKVEGRTDYHTEVEGWGREDIGGFLHGHIENAIEMGKAGQNESEVAWAGQVIDKGLQVFFYHSVYYELYLKKRKNFDEAYGYYGLDFDGEPRDHAPLANNAAGREDEFGLTINRPIFKAFIDARHALDQGTDSNEDELGDDEQYDEAWRTIDRKMLQILGHYAVHEIDGLTAENADIKLIEARVIWEAVAPYAEHVDAGTADAVMNGLYPGGVPERSADDYFYTGLEDVRDGVVEVDTQVLRSDMLEILGTLEE